MQQPDRSRGHTSKIYEWLADREQQAVDSGGPLPGTSESGTWDGSLERLARFRRREPVDMKATGLPSWTRFDRSAPHAWMQRVVAHPDGQLQFREGVARWLDENCRGAYHAAAAAALRIAQHEAKPLKGNRNREYE